MPDAPSPSIAQPPVPDQPALPRHLRRVLAALLADLEPALRASAAACDAERYRKHFDALGHLGLLLVYALGDHPSLRRGYTGMLTCPGLAQVCGLLTPDGEGLTVSFSQFAASNTSRPAEFLAGLLPALLVRARQVAPHDPALPPRDLLIYDTTFVRLSLRVCPWLARRDPAGAGLNVLVGYRPASDLPEDVGISDTRTNDVQRFDRAVLDDPARLASLREQTLAFDLGFYSHRRFAQLRAAGVHLVSRLHRQARVVVVAEQPVPAPLPDLPVGRITVERDAAIILGSPNNRAGAVLPGMRLVEAVVQPRPRAARRGAEPVRYRLVTDRWDLSAALVVLLYLWRWEIEQFFRWLKRILGVLRPVGTSRNAVEVSIYLALIVHLLCVILAAAGNLGRRSTVLLALLPGVLAHLRAADRPTPHAAVRQLSLPGWPTLHPPPT